jgi:hypothetical protein
MNLLSDIFYILCPIFIGVEVYQLLNKNKVYTKFNPNLDIKDTIPHFIFYLLKLLYLFWIPIGLFSHLRIYFLFLILLSLFKYVVVFTKKNIIINLYDVINTLISSFLLIVILIQGLFQ